jgi:Flp pilus assembly protein TadG
MSAQLGVAAVEFALVCALLATLLIGIMEFGRVLFYWNSATEATRLGARLAVVCSQGDADIKSKMRVMASAIPANKISIDYYPTGCDINTCESVTVSIAAGVTIYTVIPFIPISLQMPAFSTRLPRESMESTNNPVCS